jgi:hypothetical protein
MVSIKEHIPKSAKKMPCWIFTQIKYDLVYLTDDEKYFVSTDHKRVYPLIVVDGWSMAYPLDKDISQLKI